MSESSDPGSRERALSFGARAQQYDQARPSYPADLMDDLAALHPVRALDVGCGTGIAARALTERGVAVLGVEPDARMAEIARSHGISFEVAPFESWPERGRSFDLIISGQAWHWIEPVAGTAKAVRLLEPAGTLALFWNVSELDAEQQRAIDAAYAQYAPALDGRALARGGVRPMAPRHRAELEASAGLRDTTDRLYRWTRSYTRDEWLDLIQTHSDHSTLPASVLADLLGGVGEAIDSFGGRVLAQYSTQAVFARRATWRAWQGGTMQLLTIPEAAESLGAPVTRVHQYLRDGELLALRGDDGVRRIPTLFVHDGRPVKSLRAVITLLRDARYTDEEIVDWLFRADDSLPGAPIDALRENRGTEVKRRAQAAGF